MPFVSQDFHGVLRRAFNDMSARSPAQSERLGLRLTRGSRWRVSRSSEARDDIVTYAFLFEGGSLADDWELDVLLPAPYGAEEAERMAGEWSETFASLRRWADTSVADGLETNQCVWTFDPVR